MSSYLLKISSILVFLFLVFIIIDIIYVRMIEASIKNREINNLILGDSHTQSAINSSINPNTLNISNLGENYFYSYYKLRYYSNIYKLQNVFVNVSYNNLSSFYDDYNAGYKHKSVLFHKYLPVLTIDGIYELMKKDFLAFCEAMRLCFRYELRYILLKKDEDSRLWDGEHEHSLRSNLNDTITNKIIQKYFYDKDLNVLNKSESQMYYLKNMAEYCQKNNINLIFINTPLNYKYRNKIPSDFIEEYKSIKSVFKEIMFIDYSEILLHDSCFYDADHLNSYGSDSFTIRFSDTLKSFSTPFK